MDLIPVEGRSSDSHKFRTDPKKQEETKMNDNNSTKREVKRLNLIAALLIVVGIGFIIALNLNDGTQSTGVTVTVPEIAIPDIPEDLVKQLVEKGTTNLAFANDGGEIHKVVALFIDGSIKPCNKILESSSPTITDNLFSSLGITAASAIHKCNGNCCGGGPGSCKACSGWCCPC